MKKTEEGRIPSENLFWVVGIGASAGGLNAFKQLIQTIPADSGMAYILVQHLDPNHESILSELLQKSSAIPIHEIIDSVHVEPNNIYVIPSNKFLTANDGVLNLTERLPGKQKSTAIDVFFTSLADVHQSQAIGVVLSGTGDDGTRGLKAIKLNGGITFAQEPQTAAHAEMPQNAINADVVDLILSPDQIVQHLIDLNKIWRNKSSEEKARDSVPDEFFIKKILSLIEVQKGVDFSYYKQTTIQRRINRRILLKNLPGMERYYILLNENSAEVNVLYQDFLIPVTDFFRDQPTFDNLCNVVLPAIIKNRSETEPLRVWVVGCSTGQEAFSIGICIHEFLENSGNKTKFQVFATDISEIGITKARSGFYSKNDVGNVSDTRLEKYFTASNGGYLVNKSIRDHCVFACHNILADPPFANMDLISCRNVLIYMENFLQRKAMTTFHYALKQKGLLLLGKSESTGNSSDLFGTFSDIDKIYIRNSVPGRYTHVAAKRRDEVSVGQNNNASKEQRINDDYERNAEAVILSKFPDGVIVNDQFDIVQFRGSTGDWLEPPSGKPSLNVLKMARRGLVLELRSALLKAKKSEIAVVAKGVSLQLKGWKTIVTIEVTPLLNTINRYFLIQFINTEEVPDKKQRSKQRLKPHEIRTQQLEKELIQSREDMRTFAQDQEAGHEELLSANEELVSGSEELRSLNEELEISKEELQSTVEELSASNQELAVRNEQLNYSRQYAEAIVATIREPLIVLDKDFRVKSANASFYKTYGKTRKETEDKLFFELEGGQWDILSLRNLLERSLTERTFYERFELTHNFSVIGERTILLNARKIFNESSQEHLILLAIDDITERRILENEIKKNSDFLKAILETTPQIMTTATAGGVFTYFNKYFLDYSGLTLSEALTAGLFSILHTKMYDDLIIQWKHSINTGQDFQNEVLLKRHDDVYRWHVFKAHGIHDDGGKITSWVGVASDIHDSKVFSDELEKQVVTRTQLLKESNMELEHSNENLEQFAFIASHDLQEPLRKIKTFSNMLSGNFSSVLPPDAQKLIDKIHASSERMSKLIQEVLNFSRIDTSRNSFVETNLASTLNNAIQDVNLLITEKSATINIDTLPVIQAIPFQMNQLFSNLLNNALKFSRDGVPSVITISSRYLTQEETEKHLSLNTNLSYCEISVEDNGIGFEENYAEKIFQIFQRLRTQKNVAGTGIGLALCRKIVLNHHGVIFARSANNSGAIIHIILPLTQEVPEVAVNSEEKLL